MYNFTCLFQQENTYMQLFWDEAHLLVSHIVDPTNRAYWDLNLASSLEGKKGDGVGPEEHCSLCKATTSSSQLHLH